MILFSLNNILLEYFESYSTIKKFFFLFFNIKSYLGYCQGIGPKILGTLITFQSYNLNFAITPFKKLKLIS